MGPCWSNSLQVADDRAQANYELSDRTPVFDDKLRRESCAQTHGRRLPIIKRARDLVLMLDVDLLDFSYTFGEVSLKPCQRLLTSPPADECA